MSAITVMPNGAMCTHQDHAVDKEDNQHGNAEKLKYEQEK